MLGVVPIRTKRWNDPAEPEDGYRLLVCRYRPRGVPSASEPWDAWCKALGPSEALHADFYGKTGGPELTLEEYERRYREEMTRARYWLDGFAVHLRRGDTITLLCSSACTDPARCHRTILAGMLEALAFPAPADAAVRPGAKVVRRRAL
ncbi:MAG: hypothetical protein JWP97_5733 [Labilithrix sp.]|nr:hypothetical protein [Labilithrix sp.]